MTQCMSVSCRLSVVVTTMNQSTEVLSTELQVASAPCNAPGPGPAGGSCAAPGGLAFLELQTSSVGISNRGRRRKDWLLNDINSKKIRCWQLVHQHKKGWEYLSQMHTDSNRGWWLWRGCGDRDIIWP